MNTEPICSRCGNRDWGYTYLPNRFLVAIWCQHCDDEHHEELKNEDGKPLALVERN